MDAVLHLSAVVGLLAANAFFVLTEFAITRVRPTQLDELEAHQRASGSALRHAVEHIDAYLAACQLGITVASLGLGVVGERAFHELFEPVLGDAARIGSVAVAGVLAFLLITVLHIVVGELTPKSLAIARTERSALFISRPMRLFYLATRPFVDSFNALGNLLLRPFGIPPAREAGHSPHSEDELRGLIAESEEEGILDPEEREYADRVFTFGDREISEIMIERADVATVSGADAPSVAAERIVASGHTRLPVTENGRVAAILHANRLLARRPAGADDGSVGRLGSEPLRIEANMPLDEALKRLRANHEQMAMVERDGDWVGIVTVEDLLEQIVGGIEDEFD